MATRLFLLCILCTIGFEPSSITALDLSLGFARQPLRAVTAAKGRPVVLPCEPDDGSNNAVVSWRFNGEQLALLDSDAPADGASGGGIRRTIMPDGSLFIKRFVHRSGESTTASPSSGDGGTVAPSPQPSVVSDVGVYQCVLSNDVGTLLSRTSKVNMAVLSTSFSEQPAESTVIEGDPAHFSCGIESVPDASISWEKDREPLPLRSKKHVVLSSQSKSVLLISNVEPSDAGSYKCVAVNPMLNKKRHSAEATLSVLPASREYRPPVILPVGEESHVQQIQVTAHDTLKLGCAASGYPPPQLVWTCHPQRYIEPQVVSESKIGVSWISPNTSHDGCLYVCTATNREDENMPVVAVRKLVNVTILIPPHVIKGPASQTYPTAKTVRFECELGGYPSPNVTWYKDGSLLHINGRIKQRGNSLVLSNSVTDDSGIYQCHGYNSVGEVWEAARLLVNTSRNQPNPPTGVHCIGASPNTITVTWDDLRNHIRNFMAYTVHYLATDGGEELQQVARNNTSVIEKLRPFTNYTFYVRVYSGQSASDHSERIVCRTGEGVPPVAPTVHLQALGPTSVRASWTLLRPEKSLGVIIEHRIQWRRHGHPSAHVDEVKSDVLEYTITNLMPGQRYDVRVLSATSQGLPELSDDQLPWYTIEMPAPAPSDLLLPPEVYLTVINATSIEVTWSMPLENKVTPSGFRLSYRRQTDSLIGPVFLEANKNQFLLTDLDPQIQYEIQVQAVGAGDVGGGTTSKSIHTLGHEESNVGGLMEPPSGLEAEPLSPTAIRLSWQPPSTGGDAILYYTVRYHPVQSGPGTNSSTYVRSTNLFVEVSDLKPYTVYEFQVRSHDGNNKEGPYSQKVECQTKEDVPGPPQNVQIKVLNQTTVRISWKEPRNTNGFLGAYKLYYTLEPDKPLEQWLQVVTNLSYYEISGLHANAQYELCVRASTQAGYGKTSAHQSFTIPTTMIPPESGIPVEDPDKSEETSKFWVICIAVAIGILTVLSLIALVFTMRYAKNAHSPESSQRMGRAIHHSNGNGFYRASPHSSAAPAVQQTNLEPEDHQEEIEFITPMLFTGSSTNIPPAETSTTHLDTKGGYPNSHLNGTRVPLLGNGRVPNGHLSTYHNSRGDIQLRITENPQFQQQPAARCSSCGASSSASCHCRGPQQPLLSSRDAVSAADEEEEEEPSWADSTQQTMLSDFGTDRRNRTASNGSHHRGNGQTQCA